MCRGKRGWSNRFKVPGTYRHLSSGSHLQQRDGEQRNAFERQCLRFIVSGLRDIFSRNRQRHAEGQKHENDENRPGLPHKGCLSCELVAIRLRGHLNGRELLFEEAEVQ
jgi:hypothetical protein